MTPPTLQQPTKGAFGGLCNRSACLAPAAFWWNHNTRAYYCHECAIKINAHCPLDMPQWRLVEHAAPLARPLTDEQKT